MPSSMTPNMNLTLPTVGLEAGPAYAQEINNDMSTIDGHDHSAGNGVQITPAGLSINSDLSFLTNNATFLRSVRFVPQGAPLSGGSDLGCLYENGVDLFYNDGNGNQIRLTQSGSIAGTSGAITGLVSPASASYVVGSKTFVFQSDVNKAANLDAGSVIIRKLTTSSPGITLAPPSGLGSDYTFTFPIAPPSQTSVLVMDSSGNVSATANPIDLHVAGNLTVDGIGEFTAGSLFVDVGNISASVGNIATGGNLTALGIIANLGTGLIYPGLTTNAAIIASDPKTVNVWNQSNSVFLPIVVGDGVGVTSTVILAGGVNSAGTRINGGNFTSVRNALGNYTVTYGAGLFDGSSIPVATATAAGLAGSFTIAKPVITVSATSSFTLIMHDGGGSNVDCGFNFIAYGGRGN